jgi:Glycosyltransferase family 87
VTLNIADSGVIDVGYAGVVGADLLTSGEPIYGESAFPDDNPFGDTYGPANYYAYVPFELALPWSGEWDALPAAHAAAIAFDLATVIGLIFLGRRLRPGRTGRDLGLVLAFAWLAFPYTAFALQSNSNDALVAALVVWSLVAFASPLARGALLALAAATKFAPLVLAPLYARGERGLLAGRQRVSIAVFAAAFTAVIGLMLAHPAIDPGLATFWERTITAQADRESPFSLWGQAPALEPLRVAAIVAVAGLALLLAFAPKRRSLPQLAALAAALLIAVQLTTEHWFYLYIPWFLGPLLAALAGGRDPWRGATVPSRR